MIVIDLLIFKSLPDFLIPPPKHQQKNTHYWVFLWDWKLKVGADLLFLLRSTIGAGELGFRVREWNGSSLTFPSKRRKFHFPCSERLVTKQKKSFEFFVECSKLATTYSSPKGVPSVLESLTSVFGMRTGGPSPPNHQLRIFNDSKDFFI